MSKISVRLDRDSAYPFYLSDEGDTVIQVEAATVERWKRIEAEFDQMQDEMAEAVKNHE